MADKLAAVVSLAVSVVGIVFLGWDWREIIVLYWLGNVTIGFTTLIDILRSDTSSSPFSKVLTIPSVVIKAASSVFFFVHYGLFTLVHGFIVYMLITGQFGGSTTMTTQLPIESGPLLSAWLIVFVATLVGKLLMPAAPVTTDRAMAAPYSRIMIMHFGIIIGAFLISMFKLPAAAALFLVLLNAAAELRSGESSRHTAK